MSSLSNAKTCENCGGLFQRPPTYSPAQWRPRRYCSQSCSKIASVQPIEPRFWRKVDRSGGVDACWLWVAGLDSSGYGLFNAKSAGLKRHEKAHRFSFFLSNGYFPGHDRVVMHICDVRRCVNPAHLLDGTTRENTLDMDNKGRRKPARGRQNNHNILTQEQVLEIRKRRSDGETLKAIAADYGISFHQVHSIEKRKSWAWLE